MQSGEVRAAAFSPQLFDYGRNRFADKIPADLGFAGFRVAYPFFRRDKFRTFPPPVLDDLQALMIAPKKMHPPLRHAAAQPAAHKCADKALLDFRPCADFP